MKKKKTKKCTSCGKEAKKYMQTGTIVICKDCSGLDL